MTTPLREEDLGDDREIMVKKFLELSPIELWKPVENFLYEQGIDSSVPGVYNLAIAFVEAFAEERTRAMEYLNK
jgi:hypothetical protein